MPKRISRRQGGPATKKRKLFGIKEALQLASSASNAYKTATSFKRKQKQGGSATTKRRKYNKVVRYRQPQADLGIQKSYWVYVGNKTMPKFSSRIKTGALWNTYEAVSAFSFSSSVSTSPSVSELHQQVANTWATLSTQGALQNVNNLSYSSVSAAFSGQNPNTTIATQASNAFMVFKALSGSFEITNQEQSNLILRVYVCLCNKSMAVAESALTCWNKALDEKAGGVRGAGNVNAQFPDAKPLKCGKYFSERWKIIKTKYIELPAGFTHKMSYTHIVNKLIDYTVIQANAQIKDVTIDFLFTMRGTPINKTTAQTHAAASSSNVVFGPSKIIGIGFQKYIFKPASIDVPLVGYQDNFISTAAPTNLWEINDESGVAKDIYPIAEVA